MQINTTLAQSATVGFVHSITTLHLIDKRVTGIPLGL